MSDQNSSEPSGPGAWTLFSTPRGALSPGALICLGAGEQASVDSSFSERRLSSYAFVYVSAGSGWFRERLAGPATRINAPAYIWVAPGQLHGYGPSTGGWVEHWLLFEGTGVAIYRELGILEAKAPVVELRTEVPELTLRFSELRNALSLPGRRAGIEASLTTQRILLSVLDYRPGAIAPESRERALLDELKKLATGNYSMHDLAATLGLSIGDLRTLVRAQTGLTPIGFVIEARISLAQVLLGETSLDIRGVAARVGYPDQAYFSRLFSRQVGISPSAFRSQQMRGRYEIASSTDGDGAQSEKGSVSPQAPLEFAPKRALLA